MSLEYNIIHELSESQELYLLDMYKNESWCKERNLEGVKKMLKNSWIIVIINQKDDTIIAFARVLTDFVYRAYIYDVIVSKDYRGLGFGKLIIQSLLYHKDLQQVERIELSCIDKNVAFYKKFGFEMIPEGSNGMRYAKK